MNSTFAQRDKKLTKKNIQLIYRAGQKIYHKSFILIWKLENGGNKSKMLISIPKRQIKKAVDRNYIKRIIKELYRENQNDIVKLSQSITLQILLMHGTFQSTLQFTYKKESTLTSRKD